MKPSKFDYYRAENVDAALAMLDAIEDSKLLAGGQSLVPAMNFRLAAPAALIDLNTIESMSSYREVDSQTAVVEALVRHSDLELPSRPGGIAAALATVAGYIGHAAVRSRGTLCGSLAHADPASEWCLVARVLDARLHLLSMTGERFVAARDFFQGAFTTELRPDELLYSVHLGGPAHGSVGYGFSELAARPGDFASSLSFAAVEAEGQQVVSYRLGIGGLLGCPVRSEEYERANVPSDLRALIAGAGEIAASVIEACIPTGSSDPAVEQNRSLAIVIASRAMRAACLSVAAR